MVAVAGSILGERGGEHLLPGQQAAEPQRTDAGEFDLHQNHIGVGDGRSVVAQPEIQLRIPPAQVGIKGDAYVFKYREVQNDIVTAKDYKAAEKKWKKEKEKSNAKAQEELADHVK